MTDKDKTEIEKPSKALISLCEIGIIEKLAIEYRQIGTDTAETYIIITGNTGEVSGLWHTYKPFLDIGIGYNYVARIHRHMIANVHQWKKFVKKNAKEMAEYKRLKAKFEK